MPTLERPTIISIVRSIKQQVARAQIAPSINDKQRRFLLELYWELDELEGRLILEDMRAVIDQIAKDAVDLSTIADKLDKKIAELKDISDKVKRLSDAIGALVNIVGAAIAIGV